MFARISTIPLKADSRAEYVKVIETTVIPRLRAQKGFLDEIALVSADGKTGFGRHVLFCLEHGRDPSLPRRGPREGRSE